VSAVVRACEPVGRYWRIRVEGIADPGAPGQFHMLRALDSEAFLGRPLSAMRVADGLVDYLCDVRGPGLAAACRQGAELDVQGPFGHGFDLAAAGPRPLLCAGGIGIAVMPWLAELLPAATLVAGFRDSELAVAAELVPSRRRLVVVDPALVTEPLEDELSGASCVLACGPDPMLRAVAERCAEAGVPCQAALEAPMACGFGACYGCAVRLDGRLLRLCVEGPVVDARRLLAGELARAPA
jgi:dihydroorotate dehydrogenase electron transfer subunit